MGSFWGDLDFIQGFVQAVVDVFRSLFSKVPTSGDVTGAFTTAWDNFVAWVDAIARGSVIDFLKK